MLVKEALGQRWLDRQHAALRAQALAVWTRNPRIEVLGLQSAAALPIFSFRVRDGAGGYVHHQLFTRMLSDVFGIQARGGCACAGPYAHRLLGIDAEQSNQLRAAIAEGAELEKPGWIRLNLSALLSGAKANKIIEAVDKLASDAKNYTGDYRGDPASGRFAPTNLVEESLAI